jgi:hypothetical protein
MVWSSDFGYKMQSDNFLYMALQAALAPVESGNTEYIHTDLVPNLCLFLNFK